MVSAFISYSLINRMRSQIAPDGKKQSHVAGSPDEVLGGSVGAIKVASGLLATRDSSELMIPNPSAST